jgi:hypothetical protein
MLNSLMSGQVSNRLVCCSERTGYNKPKLFETCTDIRAGLPIIGTTRREREGRHCTDIVKLQIANRAWENHRRRQTYFNC